MDLEFGRSSTTMLLRAGMAVMGHMNLYREVRVNVKLVWLKAVRPRHLKKGRFLESFPKIPSDLIRMEKSQEGPDHRELSMVVPFVRFISVREELVGKNIVLLSYLSCNIGHSLAEVCRT
jgi:hypothetical protein